MKELTVTVSDEDFDKMIQHFEDEMLEKYQNAIQPFVPLFAKMGCSLRLKQQWVNNIHNTWSIKRLPMEKGYECGVSCIVERDGKEAEIACGDGDDDYTLITTWTVSSYMPEGFKKPKIRLCAAMDDVNSDLTEFLFDLKQERNKIRDMNRSEIVDFVVECFAREFGDDMVLTKTTEAFYHMGCFALQFLYVPLKYTVEFVNDRDFFSIDISDEKGARTSFDRIRVNKEHIKFDDMRTWDNDTKSSVDIEDRVAELKELLERNEFTFLSE